MKNTFNKTKLVLGTFFLILLVCCLPSLQGSAVNEKPASPKSIISVNAINISTQGIDIENDSAFGLYGFPGSGTASTPYLIENYSISTNNQSIGIKIANTAKSFIIKNCTLSSVGGIYPYGIYVTSVTSNVIRIENNTITNSNASAILVENSNNAVIQNNVFTANTKGIFVNNANNTIVNQNIGTYNNNTALYALNSHNLTFANNTFKYNKGDCILIVNGYNATIEKNVLTNGNGNGVTLTASNDSVIWNNTIANNGVTGVWIDIFSWNNLVYENVLESNSVNQAWCDNPYNRFYSGTQGNYYSDFVDSPGNTYYIIPSGMGSNAIDPYPLFKDLTNMPIYTIVTQTSTTTATSTTTQTSTSTTTSTKTTSTTSISITTTTKATAVSIVGVLLAIPALIYFRQRKRRKE